jgi:uncharacterized protein (TIGR02117 family)
MNFRKSFIITGRILLVLFAIVGLYLLAAFVLSRISTDRDFGQSNDVTMYILTNGDHTDIVVPVKNQLMDWSREIKFQNTISKDTTAKYLAIGWGDKGFYLNTPTWSQLNPIVAFKAVFGLDASAIHATFYRSMQENQDCKRIMISNEQYARLIIYLKNSFKVDTNGHFINIKTNANYDSHDAFYDANGTYSLFYTCNTWLMTR